MRTTRILQAIFWIAVYITIRLAPLLILLIGPQLPDQGFWQRFSVALGFAGLAMMALQFVLTARFKVIKARPMGAMLSTTFIVKSRLLLLFSFWHTH
jgi:predicted ferric reductase